MYQMLAEAKSIDDLDCDMSFDMLMCVVRRALLHQAGDGLWPSTGDR